MKKGVEKKATTGGKSGGVKKICISRKKRKHGSAYYIIQGQGMRQIRGNEKKRIEPHFFIAIAGGASIRLPSVFMC